MAFTLTAIIVSICVIDAYIIGRWACDTTITPLKEKKTSYAIAQVIAFIIAFALIGLCWFLFTHQVFPQWLTGVGSQPSLADTANKQDMGDRFIVLLMFPFMVAGLAMGVTLVTMYVLTIIECKHTGQQIGTVSERRKSDIFDNSVFAGAGASVLTIILCIIGMMSKPGGEFRYAFDGLNYHQVTTTNKTYDEKVLYENNKDITIDVYNWRDSKWMAVSDITTIKQLPTIYTNQYRISKGYDTLKVGDIWFTELDNVSGETPKGLEDKAVIKITKVTLVSENVSFLDGTNTDIVRSTQDLKRIHIEYEVTNINELRASTQNKEDLKQFIDGK